MLCTMNLFLISTLSCILEHLAPFLIKFISSHIFTEKRYDIELLDELNDLKQEMAGISIVDEFSKYAKLQRKYNKLESVLKDNMNQRLSLKMKFQLSSTYVFRALNSILILSLLYMYKNEPVIILPEDSLWPIQNLLNWSSQYGDGISLLTWVIIARLGVSACMKLNA